MALALLANTAPRINAILGRTPGAFSATGDTSIGAFPSDAEILAATLEADEMVVTQGYFQSVNGSLCDQFQIVFGNLVNGDHIPFHHGIISLVELSADGTAWTVGVKAESIDDVINAIANEGYIQTAAFDYLYWLGKFQFYTSSPFGRVTYPEFTRTSILQSNKNEETLVIATAVRLLVKNASPAPFENWIKESERGIEQLQKDGAYSAQLEGN